MVDNKLSFKKICNVILNNIAPFFPDKTHLKLKFYLNIGYKLDLRNPQTFCEKLQWLKLYNRKPEYTVMVDKYLAKDYVAKIIGQEHIIPTIGVWDKAENIDFEKLPNQFVLKTTHDSGGVIICKDKSMLDIKKTVSYLNGRLKKTNFFATREWPYKNVMPRIIAECYMEDESGKLWDYKFLCFNGNVRFIKVDFNRFIKHQANYYDTKWNLQEFGLKRYPPDPNFQIDEPISFNLMTQLAEKLSQQMCFLRVDFYNINGRIYFGELTFYPGSGFSIFTPMKWDRILGSLIKLPE
jgi:hypothetical protein